MFGLMTIAEHERIVRLVNEVCDQWVRRHRHTEECWNRDLASWKAERALQDSRIEQLTRENARLRPKRGARGRFVRGEG